MTRKEYVLLAERFGRVLATIDFGNVAEDLSARRTVLAAIKDLCADLVADNPRFDSEKFRRAIFKAEDDVRSANGARPVVRC